MCEYEELIKNAKFFSGAISIIGLIALDGITIRCLLDLHTKNYTGFCDDYIENLDMLNIDFMGAGVLSVSIPLTLWGFYEYLKFLSSPLDDVEIVTF